jgi:hypothetical protein
VGKINWSIGPNVELFTYLPTEFEILQKTWDGVGSWDIFVQTFSLEHRVIMKFREWVWSKGCFPTAQWWSRKGYCTMDTMMTRQSLPIVPWAQCWLRRTKKGLLYHGHIVERQAHMCIGSNPLIILFYTEGWVKVSVPWAHCWDPRKCHHTMGTALRAKQRLLWHVHSAEGQGRVTVP